MSARSVSASLLLCLLGLGLGCGGSDSEGDGAMCGGVDACGGKLEGSWKLSNACFIVLEQPKLEFCKTATAELHAKMSDGNVTFEKDSYERHMQIETELLLKLPKQCKDDNNKECSAFGGRLSGGTTLSCDDADGGGCECTAGLSATYNDSGQYTIRGNKVELTGDTFDYCVKGGTLTLKPTQAINMSGSPVTSQLQTSFEKN